MDAYDMAQAARVGSGIILKISMFIAIWKQKTKYVKLQDLNVSMSNIYRISISIVD